MVEETPKPFACTHDGCAMSFTNEDHLNVHQKKHEMVLNLGLGKANTFADQTPTPTRFLRNCEEVGLFQDLQNVNPFEETFKRAAELVKNGLLPEHELNGDDTLHTPHVFPHIPEENIAIYRPDGNTAPECVDDVDNAGRMEHDYAMEIDTRGHKVAAKKRAVATKKTTKTKLKELLINKKDAIQPAANVSNPIPILPSVAGAPKYVLINLPAAAPRHPARAARRKPPTDDDDGKRRESLERNRRAAIRSREKRKRWVQNLEERYDGVCKLNQALQKEVKHLRNEVAHLKTLLLAHKQCPVTRALNADQSVKPAALKVQSVVQPTVLTIVSNQGESSSTGKQVLREVVIKDLTFSVDNKTESVIVLNDGFSEP